MCRGPVRDIAVVMQQQAAHGTGVGLCEAGAPVATTEEMRAVGVRCESIGRQIEAALRSMLTRGKQSVQRMEAMIASIRIEELPQRMDDLTASSAHVTKGIGKQSRRLRAAGLRWRLLRHRRLRSTYGAASRTVDMPGGPGFPRPDLTSHQQY